MNQRTKRKLFAITVTCIIGWVFSYFATNILLGYAVGLFIWLPAVMGITATMIYGKKFSADKLEMRNISFLSLVIFCAGLLTYAWEGLICILMAAPIGFF